MCGRGGTPTLGVETVSAYDEDQTGISDQAQLAHARTLGAVLFTHDPDLIEIASEINHQGNEHCGVIFVEMHRKRWSIE